MCWKGGLKRPRRNSRSESRNQRQRGVQGSRRMPKMRAGTSQHGLFAMLKKKPPDPLLSLIAQFRDDPRKQKIDLGVGVYRDANGITPVMRCVKEAERLLLAQQSTKSYLGSEGDVGFVNLLKPLVCGDSFARDPHLVGV